MDGFFPINFPKSTKTRRKKTNNASEMCCFFRTFSCVYTRSSPLGCKFVCTSAVFNLKRVPGALFSALSYLRHVKMSECGLTTWAFPQAHQYSGNCDVSLAACYYERFIFTIQYVKS